MVKIRHRVIYYLGRIALLAFFGMGIFVRCANTMAPQGGPRDSIPPRVVSATPAEGTLNFKAKRVYIEFDEYVKLKDQQKEFFTSPAMKYPPVLLVKGKGIQIDIRDTLKENTTYALNFGSSIEDNNEGNPFYSYRYVFSTGDYIDSMVMSGYTVDAYKRDSASKTFIFFYEASKDSIPDYDSTVFNNSPDIIARAENNGIFIANNLQPVDYRIYAVQDNNGNQTYEPGIDKIGFLDSVYNPSNMPAFSAWQDTMRHYMTADPQLYFRLFKDEQFKRQYLADQKRPLRHKVVLSFGAHYPEIDTLAFFGIDSSRIITEYLKPTRDSIAYWFDVPADELPDTIKGFITYMKHDSLNNMVPESKDLALGWKFFESKEQERQRKDRDKAREQAIKEGKEPELEPNPFKVTVEATSTLNPEKNIPMTFDYPLVKLDTAAISVTRQDGENVYMVRTTVERDTANMRRFTIKAQWAPGQKYKLEIPAGTFVNVAGERNDTLSSEFTVMDPEKYGTIVFNVIGKTPDSRYVLQLVDQSGSKVINEILYAKSGKHYFRYVDPGEVRLRIIEDINGNGKWDEGNMVQRRQPERVEFFVQVDGQEEIQAKVNWELEFDVDMNVVFAPVTMQSIMEQIRKQEEIRVRKYLEELEKNPRRNDRNQRQQSSPNFNPGSFGGSGMGNFMR